MRHTAASTLASLLQVNGDPLRLEAIRFPIRMLPRDARELRSSLNLRSS